MPYRLLLILLAAAPIGAGRLSAQVSPGPLAEAHRSLEGLRSCTQCHGPGREAMPARCTACHTDIGWLASRNRGFHGSAPVKSASCASCHPDHAGAEFRLIKWPDGSAARFDHRRAAWPLEQSHADVACATCHRPDRRVSPAAARAPGGRSNWTGLEPTCATCHTDPHRGALGSGCTSCHDAGVWARTPGFDHDTTSYPLTGRHAAVECSSCHASARLPLRRAPGGETIPIFRPVPHLSCTNCHRDPHAGGFGANCAACHTTAGFGVSGGRNFDHGVTRFPLKGRHAAVKCAGCHADFVSSAGRRPPAATCAGCHQPDPHGGAATLSGRAVDCAACHSEQGFTPGTLSVERHAATRFPLQGKHAAVRCSACHGKDGGAAPGSATERTVMRPAFATCASCHRDQHGGQLADRPGGGECATCHAPAGWTPTTFDRVAHAAAGLPLEGRHAEIRCAACHATTRAGLPPLTLRNASAGADFVMTGLERTCAGCHLDPHGGRFEPGGARPVAGGCAACHDATRFVPSTVTVTRHEQFALPLAGAHRAVPCLACHEELRTSRSRPGPMLVQGGATPSRALFETTSDCAACHRQSSPHGAQFDTREYRGACEACHDVQGFRPASRFNHDSLTSFQLDGGHRSVPCQRCHIPAPGARPAAIIYRLPATRCEDCHARRP